MTINDNNNDNQQIMKQNFFEQRIKPILLYVGTIGAFAMSIGYIILMFVLVLGFNAQTSWAQSLVFALVNALVGFVIMQFLKLQGIDFAKQLPQNQEIMKKWNISHARKKKEKRFYTMNEFWKQTIIQDLIWKALIIATTTAGIVYIVIEGSQDYNMLLLSVVNLIMFACFGLLSLVKAYDFYNIDYIPYIADLLNNEKEEQEKEAKEQEQEQEINADEITEQIVIEEVTNESIIEDELQGDIKD